MDRIYYTKSGLCRCGGCAKHFFIEPSEWKSASCPFCAAPLTEQLRRSPEKSIARYGSGKSRIAAGLLALGLGAAGCDDEELIERADMGRTPTLDMNPYTDPGVAEYGAPLLDAELPPVERDMISVEPDYGAPPILDMSPDFSDVAEYGAPPLPDQGSVADPDQGSVDEGVTIDMSPDFSAAPEYGAPPIPDEDG